MRDVIKEINSLDLNEEEWVIRNKIIENGIQ